MTHAHVKHVCHHKMLLPVHTRPHLLDDAGFARSPGTDDLNKEIQGTSWKAELG